MKAILVLLVMLTSLACAKRQPVVAPKVVAESPYVRVSDKFDRWSFEVPRTWSAFPTQSEGAWQNKEKTNSMVTNSRPCTGNANDIIDDLREAHEEGDLQLLKSFKGEIQGHPSAVFALSGPGIVMLQFVVVTNTHAYTLVCASTMEALDDLKPVCAHAVETWQVK